MVGQGRRHAKHRHHGVADVFVHIGAVVVQTLAGLLQVGVDDLDHPLRFVAELFRQFGEADEIGEEHCGLAPLAAEPEGARVAHQLRDDPGIHVGAEHRLDFAFPRLLAPETFRHHAEQREHTGRHRRRRGNEPTGGQQGVGAAQKHHDEAAGHDDRAPQGDLPAPGPHYRGGYEQGHHQQGDPRHRGDKTTCGEIGPSRPVQQHTGFDFPDWQRLDVERAAGVGADKHDPSAHQLSELGRKRRQGRKRPGHWFQLQSGRSRDELIQAGFARRDERSGR